MREFLQSSSKAIAAPDKAERFEDEFLNCPVGHSFRVKFDEIKENTLRPIVSKANKRLGKKFKVIVHDELQVYEVARLPDGLKEI